MIGLTEGVGIWMLSQFVPKRSANLFQKKSNQMIPIKVLEHQAPGLFSAKINMDLQIVRLLSRRGCQVVLRMTSKYLRPLPEATWLSTYSTETNQLWRTFLGCYPGLDTVHVRAVHPSATWTQSDKLGGKGSDRAAEFSNVIEEYIKLYDATVAKNKKSVR